jgi:hypothetical protein
MIITLSQAFVTLLGIVIGLLSLWGLVAPRRLLRLVRGVMEHRAGIYGAVFARLLLGAALIVCASVSRYPTTFMVLGWIAVAAALGLALIGRRNMRRLVAWFDQFPPTFVRLWLLIGFGFGVFLIHGAAWSV